MSTREEIATAARARRRTREFDIGGGAKVVLRELTRKEQIDLNKRLFQTGPDGELLLAKEDGTLDQKGQFYAMREGVDFRREWLAATMEPADAVDVILADDVPESLKRELVDAARELCGVTVKSAAGN